jgi:hypothetical protein
MDDEEPREVEISIEPRVERLQALGISREEFEQALPQALDDYHDLIESVDDPDAVPGIEQLRINVGGKEMLLGDVAEIKISGDLI